MDLRVFSLEGKVALVTGASKGLGRAMSRGLAKAGAELALVARNEEDLRETQAEMESLGQKARYFTTDILDRNRVQETVSAVLDEFGRVDILVNNAGVNVRKPVLELTEEDWDWVVDTNLKGYFLMTQAVAPHMIANKYGKIINMASILGTIALPSQLAYCSSKGGIMQMTKVMAVEWAQHHINVNAIGPTYFDTPLVQPVKNDPERYQFIVNRTPMGRFGKPEELEGVVVFLASSASDFITGQTIFVDGGWTVY